MSEESKRKAPAFQFYADDFLAGTSDMSAEEVGGYIRLLCHQWTKGGIPNDQERAARMAGLIGSPSIGYVLAKFSPCDDGMLRNARLEQVRDQQTAFKAKQAVSGKAGAEKRWKKCPNDGDPNGEPIATPMATPMAERWPEDSSPSPTPTPKIQIKIQPPIFPRGSEEFENLKLRIGSWFGRRPTTNWSAKELRALKDVLALDTAPEDIDALEARYNSGDPYLRRDPVTLLNNWNTEIDRAKQPATQTTSANANDPIARRNAALGDIAAHSAEATRRSREIDRLNDLRYEQTGKTPFDP